jgi:hypothetical protein
MKNRAADTINQRCYFEVIFGTSYIVESDFVSQLDTEDEFKIPGFIASERFISNIRILKPTNVPFYDCGGNWKIVRTGWDNIMDQSVMEQIQITPLKGFHFTDLAVNEQSGIRSWCVYKKMEIDFDFVKFHPFNPSVIK